MKKATKKAGKSKEPTVRELLDDIKRSIETLELIEKIKAGKPVRVEIREAAKGKVKHGK